MKVSAPAFKKERIAQATKLYKLVIRYYTYIILYILFIFISYMYGELIESILFIYNFLNTCIYLYKVYIASLRRITARRK